jgi:hypothetical protein
LHASFFLLLLKIEGLKKLLEREREEREREREGIDEKWFFSNKMFLLHFLKSLQKMQLP